MLFGSQKKQLEVARTEAQAIFDAAHEKPAILSARNFHGFLGELGYALRHILEEKEILFFAALQWLVIGLAYIMWTQILDWIPQSLWDEVARSSKQDDEGAFTLVNLVLLGWSFLVVVVASYPISILNAAMTSSHYLRLSHQTSTIPKCFNLAFKNLGRLWIFTTIDAWVTVTAILDRLPGKKRRKRTALDEAVYYAWKVGTIGVAPALVAGRGYAEAAKDSIAILKKHLTRAIAIRMGYSLVCWVIGIAAYAGSIWYFVRYGNHSGKTLSIYNFYVLMAVPVFIAVGVTSVLVRPFFLIASSKLYSDAVPVGRRATALTIDEKFDPLFFAFCVLLAVFSSLYFLGDEIGIRDWIEGLAARDIQDYRQSQPNNP